MKEPYIAVDGEAIDAGGPPQQAVGNLLLGRLSAADYALLRPGLRRVPILSGDRLGERGAAIERVCFPESGIAGFLDMLGDGRRVAIGLLGREGFAGWPALMGNDVWPHEVVARGPDATALAIDAMDLQAALDASDTLRWLLLRYASSFVTQMAGTLTSNLIQTVEERTARWLLMYHDRIDGDELVITHDELGAMLGVRRSSITDAMHQLEGCGSIRGGRGRLLIRDRTALVALAGDTYGRAEDEYERLVAATMM